MVMESEQSRFKWMIICIVDFTIFRGECVLLKFDVAIFKSSAEDIDHVKIYRKAQATFFLKGGGVLILIFISSTLI